MALSNHCLGQADALFKAAIQLFNTSKDSLDQFATKTRPASRIAIDFVSDLLSLMIVVPDSPESGVLNLVRGILNVIDACPAETKTTLQVCNFFRHFFRDN